MGLGIADQGRDVVRRQQGICKDLGGRKAVLLSAWGAYRSKVNKNIREAINALAGEAYLLQMRSKERHCDGIGLSVYFGM